MKNLIFPAADYDQATLILEAIQDILNLMFLPDDCTGKGPSLGALSISMLLTQLRSCLDSLDN